MNPNFSKLIEEAFFDESTSSSSDKMYHLTEEKIEQFAQLIVKECGVIADFCKQANTIEDVSVVLSGHFGVDNED